MSRMSGNIRKILLLTVLLLLVSRFADAYWTNIDYTASFFLTGTNFVGQTQEVESYDWQMILCNLTDPGNLDDSIVRFTAYTGNTSSHDYDGGNIGLWWDDNTTSNTNYFTATPINSLGNIDSANINPDSTTLICNFNSPYKTTIWKNDAVTFINQGTDEGTPGYSAVTLGAYLPGPEIIPEPAIYYTTNAITNGASAEAETGTDFGEKVLGTSTTNIFSITNSGNSTLTITGLYVSGASNFQVSDFPSSVAHNTSATFSIVF